MNTKLSLSALPWKWIRLAALAVILIVLSVTWTKWWPALSNWVDGTLAEYKGLGVNEEEAAGPPIQGDSIELTPQARRNLGLTDEYLLPIKLETFPRTIVVPAVVETRPGRTQIAVSAPLTGVITHVHAVTSESVTPETLLFEIRLTHEDLVQAQTEFLTTLGELAVEVAEVERLTPAAETGVVPGRSLLERQYARDRLTALSEAQREALRLHGLSNEQIDGIAENHRLLRNLQIVAPSIDVHEHDNELRLSSDSETPVVLDEEPPQDHESVLLLIEHLDVKKGQTVTAGDPLCQLADYSRLYIEGKAFEQDISAISHAFENDWTVTAVFDEEDGEHLIEGIALSHLGAEVDREARTLSFFAELPNEILRDETNEEEQHFVSWRYRPGQRLELLVPVELMADQIVLPVDAVAREGANAYVFQQNGKRFDRRPVTILYQDQRSVVIANDGSVFPGDVVAMRSAHQMQMAMKNQAGGAVDPHAGHSH